MWNGARAHATFDTRRRGVLAFTCAVHLLALFLWTQERRLLPDPPSRAVTIFLQPERVPAAPPPTAAPALPLPAPALPAIPAVSPSPPLPEPAHRIEDDEMPRAARPEPRADTAPATAPPAPAAAAPNPAPNPIDTAQAVARAAAGTSSTQGGLAASIAQHQAGRVDRELRKGKPGVPTEADTPWGRFQRGLDSAHVDRTMTVQSDTYTAPDGVVTYRFRHGNRVRCRRAGSVGIPLRGMPAGADTMATIGSAGSTDCPKGVVWNQDN
jgi:hypothetical protein